MGELVGDVLLLLAHGVAILLGWRAGRIIARAIERRCVRVRVGVGTGAPPRAVDPAHVPVIDPPARGRLAFAEAQRRVGPSTIRQQLGLPRRRWWWAWTGRVV